MHPFLKKALTYLAIGIPVGIAENAFFGWAQMELGITNQHVEQGVRWGIQFGIPALTVAVGFWLYYAVCAPSGNKATTPHEKTEFISAKQAVEQVNAALYETDGWGQWIKAANEEGDMSPLLVGASMLANRIQIYGKPPGVGGFKPVDMDVHWQMGRWADDLSKVVRRHRPDQILYGELSFKRSDLDAFIKGETEGSAS